MCVTRQIVATREFNEAVSSSDTWSVKRCDTYYEQSIEWLAMKQ